MLAALVALILAAPAPEHTPSIHTAAEAPAAAAFAVHVSGAGPDVLLIPGLACSSEVWDPVVAHLAKSHRVHVFMLAGFAGQPRLPADAPMVATVREALARYIVENKLEKPVVVGHSLGGVLALWLAAEKPELVGGVVAVDGVPFLPALFDPSATADSARGQAEAMRAQMRQLTQAQYAANSRMSVASMVKAEADVDRIAAWGARSDPSAVGDAMAELMTTDLRPAMARVTAPVLELAAADFARDDESRKEIAARYESQLAKAPHHRVILATHARHFIMMDDLPFLLAQLDGFLAEKR